MADNIAPANMLFFSLYYDIISLISLKITQAFYWLLAFVENQTVFWDFKIRNIVWITEGSDNGDSDDQGPTIFDPYQCIGVLCPSKCIMICDMALENRAYLHIKFDNFFGLLSYITLCPNIDYQQNFCN